MSTFAFTVIGIGVSLALAIGIGAAAGLCLFIWISNRWPRLHIGKPRLRSEWMFFHEYSINDVETKQLKQSYVVPWWFGWSSRRKASWFIGFVRMKALP